MVYKNEAPELIRFTVAKLDIHQFLFHPKDSHGLPLVLVFTCLHYKRRSRVHCFASNPCTANPLRLLELGLYKLANNINASETVSWNAGQGFAPVGAWATKFMGTFNGDMGASTCADCPAGTYASQAANPIILSTYASQAANPIILSTNASQAANVILSDP